MLTSVESIDEKNYTMKNQDLLKMNLHLLLKSKPKLEASKRGAWAGSSKVCSVSVPSSIIFGIKLKDVEQSLPTHKTLRSPIEWIATGYRGLASEILQKKFKLPRATDSYSDQGL